MAIGRFWAGRVFGTNTGNIFVELEGEDKELSGKLHFNDNETGIVVYRNTGRFDGQRLHFSGQPELSQPQVTYGELEAIADLNRRGELLGRWQTNIGSAGTFQLLPHDVKTEQYKADNQIEQLHSARYDFGAIEVRKADVVRIAEWLEKEIEGSAIITFTGETEQVRYLKDFKEMEVTPGRTVFLRVHVSAPEGRGINRVVQVEFGQQSNFVLAQSRDESWALGMKETVRRKVQPYEKNYATKFKKFRFGINQVILIVGLIFIPGPESIQERAAFVLGVLSIVAAVSWFHKNYLPNASIYLVENERPFISRVGPSILSWFSAIIAGCLTALLTAFFKDIIPFIHP